MRVRILHTKHLRAGVLTLALAALVTLGASSSAAAALFGQCPPVGQNQGCSQLIVINPDGSVVVKVDPAAPASGYDGSDDTLIGLQNNSKKAIGSINLASPNQIFAFEMDGLCNSAQWPTPSLVMPANCPGPQGFGPTGYEGPNNTFSNISSNTSTGTVSFTTPVGSGGSAYWALEEALQAGQLLSGAAGRPITTPPKVSGIAVSFGFVCVGANPCAGSAQLVVTLHRNAGGAFVARRRTKTVVVGSVPIAVPGGGSASVTVSLNKQGRKLLSKGGSLNALVRVKIKSNGLGVVTPVGKVKFRRH